METVKYSISEKICTITLNRPERRNAFNAQLVNDLKSAFGEAEKDDAVKVIILKGEGQVFSAGADISYLQSLQNNTYEENLADSKNLMELYKQIYTLSKPVIAQIEGHAIAGGCGLATVCDFSYAVPEAQFGYTEVKIGFIPAIVMVFLLRKINERNAKELLLTGKLIDAQKAKEFGLINDVVPKENIAEVVGNLCNALIENTSRKSLQSTKQMIAQVQEMDLNEALNYAAEMNAKARATEDCKYGIDSFLNKKKPEWK
ncbi:MAG: enoyl-CoA hydratase/isomerase family protein [Chitinophagales bacterium]|nr:enoyl-CoA hydratase/isomerase family protein [Chitinophagales bacterium]